MRIMRAGLTRNLRLIADARIRQKNVRRQKLDASYCCVTICDSFQTPANMRIMRAEATAIEQSCCEDDAAGLGAGNSIFKERAHRVRGEEAAELYV